jgi:hypothetical protein
MRMGGAGSTGTGTGNNKIGNVKTGHDSIREDGSRDSTVTPEPGPQGQGLNAPKEMRQERCWRGVSGRC